MAKDSNTTTGMDAGAFGAGPASLRQRAAAIQVIGAPAVDRAAQRQQRLGFSLLLALGFGWDSLQAATNPAAPFDAAIGRFLVIFVVTVGTIRALGNLYDRYADQAARTASAAASSPGSNQQPIAGAATVSNTDQPATSGE